MIDIAPLAITARDLEMGTEPVIADGVRIVPAPAMARYALRARGPEALAHIIGRAVPTRIGETIAGIACLGPDEWLARLFAGTSLPQGDGLPVSIVDISARSVGMIIDGPAAATVVSAGCPLDMGRFAVGRSSRTLYETVEIVLWRETVTRFHIEVWRSFSPWLWHSLLAAAVITR